MYIFYFFKRIFIYYLCNPIKHIIYFHLTVEETETQRSQVTFPKTHSSEGKSQDLNLPLLTSRSVLSKHLFPT